MDPTVRSDSVSDRPVTIALVAGEISGDLLGSRVIRALRAAHPNRDLLFEGIGGPKMIAEGMNSLYSMERLAVMGLVEPLGRLPELLKIRKTLRERWIDQPPRFFLGIDAPDFNLGLARRLKDAGVRTGHLVSPTVWAWRPGRVKKVARAVDHLLCLFPFEPAHYAQTNLDAYFVGHPLVDELAEVPTREQVRRELGLSNTASAIAVLPGSRASEVSKLAEPMLEAALMLKARDRERTLLLPAANSEREVELRQILKRLGCESDVQLLSGGARNAVIASNAVMLASGTATLETMLLERPMAIAYRLAPLSWKLMNRLAVTRYVGLPNVFAGDAVVPELLQDDLSPAALALATEGLLFDGQRQIDALAEHREALKTDFSAAVVTALNPLLETP
ncbi:MAG: lipid-A-disaccharide synthase [Pseudomonadota bacterium]